MLRCDEYTNTHTNKQTDASGLTVASISLLGGCSLHPVKNKEKILIYTLNKTPLIFTVKNGGSFVEDVDQNSPYYSLGNLHP